MTRLSANFRRPDEGDRSRPVLMAALVVGLLIRLAILWQAPGLGAKIIDEQQYSQIARSLVAVAVEAALLTGWPVGWALATARLVERGEARPEP